jgi:hypothetical protein
MLTTKIQETVMTGERKILTLKRKSPPENQEKTGETLVPLSRKK